MNKFKIFIAIYIISIQMRLGVFPPVNKLAKLINFSFSKDQVRKLIVSIFANSDSISQIECKQEYIYQLICEIKHTTWKIQAILEALTENTITANIYISESIAMKLLEIDDKFNGSCRSHSRKEIRENNIFYFDGSLHDQCRAAYIINGILFANKIQRFRLYSIMDSLFHAGNYDNREIYNFFLTPYSTSYLLRYHSEVNDQFIKRIRPTLSGRDIKTLKEYRSDLFT
jgi:hypothetical protein